MGTYLQSNVYDRQVVLTVSTYVSGSQAILSPTISISRNVYKCRIWYFWIGHSECFSATYKAWLSWCLYSCEDTEIQTKIHFNNPCYVPQIWSQLIHDMLTSSVLVVDVMYEGNIKSGCVCLFLWRMPLYSVQLLSALLKPSQGQR